MDFAESPNSDVGIRHAVGSSKVDDLPILGDEFTIVAD
jgi:hypothetical protein